MKKICACLLALVMVAGFVGCNSTNNPSVDDFKNAMKQENVELDNFDIQENDKGFSFTAQGEYVYITGTADKKQNITAITFENRDTDSSIFETKETFEQWYAENVKDETDDYGQMTMRELKANIVAMSCIDELNALYSLFKAEDAHTLAVNTLLTKQSSEIKNWNISVSVVEGKSDLDDTIIIEAVSNEALE